MPRSIILSDALTGHFENLLRCPVCQHTLRLVDKKSLICAEKHCFDLAKQGYVNLLSHGIKSKYNKALFDARKNLAQSGFFEPLNSKLCELISAEAKSFDRSLNIVDAGCGEGSNLANIQQKLHHCLGTVPCCVGMDLSKEGIQMAARDYKDSFWCVADLAQCPFVDHAFEVILNILSPANYAEFERILHPDGYVLKVIPEKDYLKELRAVFYAETDREEYSNAKTIELFENHLALTEIVPVHYTRNLAKPLIENLVHMTPLTWGAQGERIDRIMDLNSLEITIDLAILVGRKKG
ncbi:methyltransferase family protein [Desulfitobacterium dichloroeliminans LMG P-21439]|uniref:Methyltransferase family protein n=1 Tax=Desulfitobacterium dichloroeliminans (strain LMG P-21439 / DCA1) TaxID=871963 RepID=L0F1T4_DESDL|nr:methyltransferase domain-containing protein [Desulfitobacterium dichloroeliminans]AGA67824.1 methyltransferase family protein [Desulfitobacterium dichloroeliminans LMG P-21439]